MKLNLTDKQTAYAAAILTPLLQETHGHLELIKVDDERLRSLRRSLSPISGNVLGIIIEIGRAYEYSERTKRGARTRLKRDPRSFHKMSKKGVKARAELSPPIE